MYTSTSISRKFNEKPLYVMYVISSRKSYNYVYVTCRFDLLLSLLRNVANDYNIINLS